MRALSIWRADDTNVGDAWCPPFRYYPIEGPRRDILDGPPPETLGAIVVGGGGLVAETFGAPMAAIARAPRTGPLIGWGLGESLHVDRRGGLVDPYPGPLPDYLKAFDLVGLRDFGTDHEWVPCASCRLPQFDRPRPAPAHPYVIYEHKRIAIPIEGPVRRTNAGDDIDAVLDFLASGDLVVTNSYHGAYWATLLGRRVFAIPNMSKMYRLKHAPVIARAEDWKRLSELAYPYPDALADCRRANDAFFARASALVPADDAAG